STAMTRAIRHPKPVALATAINYAIVPLLAWVFAKVQQQDDLALGLIVTASVPSTLASASVWTRRARGNDAVSMLVTMVTNFSCFLVTPALLITLAGTSEFASDIEASDLIRKLLLVVVIPIVVGQALRRFPAIAHVATTHKTLLGIFCQLGILSVVLVGAVHCGQKLEQSDNGGVAATAWALMITAVIVVHVAALWAGHFLGRLVGISCEDRIAVGFSGSQKTLMVPIHIALGFGGLTMLPVVVYHVCQLTIDTLVADWLRKRGDVRK
ncbi:MAG: bile acid:sodium symporter, partial [Pirellulales bacterium]|nr:bile acid:sodium symporter [Pirellulales bacterium]